MISPQVQQFLCSASHNFFSKAGVLNLVERFYKFQGDLNSHLQSMKYPVLIFFFPYFLYIKDHWLLLLRSCFCRKMFTSFIHGFLPLWMRVQKKRVSNFICDLGEWRRLFSSECFIWYCLLLCCWRIGRLKCLFVFSHSTLCPLRNLCF